MPASDRRLPEQLASCIIQLILDEHLQQGDRLPNEAELVRRLKAGRSSIREAVKLLASRNIVTVRQGSGTYVASNPGVVDDPLGFTFIADKERLAHDLLEVRFMVEPHIARMAAQHAAPSEIEHMHACCTAIEDAIAAGCDYAALDTELHCAIAQSSGNLVVPRLAPILNESVPLFINVTERQLTAETIRTHRAIVDAIARHDPIAAGDAMYLHLVYNRTLIDGARENIA